MDKRRIEATEAHKAKKDLAGLHVADNFEVIISAGAHESITSQKLSREAVEKTAKQQKIMPPTPHAITLLCGAVPDAKDIALTNIAFGLALREILSGNSTIDRKIKDSASTTIDKVEFSCNDKKKLLPPVVSLRFTVTDKDTGKQSDQFYRCKIDIDDKVRIQKIPDVKEYKKNSYESSNTAVAEHIHVPRASHK